MKKTIELSRFFDYLVDENDKRKLEPYLMSFRRRVDFCHYHYDQFENFYKPRVLALSELAGGEHRWQKISAEAESDAFLLNLHALVDSLPYLGCMVLSASNLPFVEKEASWDEKWLRKFSSHSWFPKFSAIGELQEFHLLQAYANFSKHRYIPPKKNDLSFLRISEFYWTRSKKTVFFPEVELKLFMQSEHDILLQKVIDVMNDVADGLEMMSGLKNTDK